MEMNFKTMVKSIDASALPDVESLIRHLRTKLPLMYAAQSSDAFRDAFDYVLQIGVKLDYSPMMLYMPARPMVHENLVLQFKQLNITLARREGHKDWFFDLFALFLGAAQLLAIPVLEDNG